MPPTPPSARTRRALALAPVVAVAALAVGASPGSAAPRAALRVTPVPNPVLAGEGAQVQITGVAPARAADIRVIARTDPSNPLEPCARTFQADSGNGGGFGRNRIPRGRFTYRGRIPVSGAVGSYRICAWLGVGTRTVRRVSAIVTVRAPKATVTATVLPPVMPATTPFTVSLQTTTERRGLKAYFRVHPANVPCAATFAGDPIGEELSEQVLAEGIGAATVTDDVSLPGAYVVCVWVGRQPAETLATAAAAFTATAIPES